MIFIYLALLMALMFSRPAVVFLFLGGALLVSIIALLYHSTALSVQL